MRTGPVVRILTVLAVLVCCAVPASGAAAEIPVTGPPTPPGMEAWDAAAKQLMRTYGLPGAALVVAYEGRVVLEHGYGYADTRAHTPVRPDSVFRLASVTKSLTAAAAGVLLSRHKLELGTRPFVTILGDLRDPRGRPPADRRLRQITVHELLAMKAGWDLEQLGFDPVFYAGPVGQALGLRGPPNCPQTIRYMLTKRLSYAPGTRYSYSNFGYCVLGEVIARVMHTSYGTAVKRLLLDPLGMRSTQLSAPRLTERRPREVHYYGQGLEVSGSQSPYVLPLSATTGAAGMVSSAIDLERYVIAASGARPGSTPAPTFGAADLAGILAPYPASGYYGWEWDGSLPGTSTSLDVEGKATYVFLSNSRPPGGTHYELLRRVAQQQRVWPTVDLLATARRSR